MGGGLSEDRKVEGRGEERDREEKGGGDPMFFLGGEEGKEDRQNNQISMRERSNSRVRRGRKVFNPSSRRKDADAEEDTNGHVPLTPITRRSKSWSGLAVA